MAVKQRQERSPNQALPPRSIITYIVSDTKQCHAYDEEEFFSVELPGVISKLFYEIKIEFSSCTKSASGTAPIPHQGLKTMIYLSRLRLLLNRSMIYHTPDSS